MGDESDGETESSSVDDPKRLVSTTKKVLQTIACWFGLMGIGLAFSTLGASVTDLAEFLGTSEGNVGLSMIFRGVGNILGSIIGGYLAEKSIKTSKWWFNLHTVVALSVFLFLFYFLVAPLIQLAYLNLPIQFVFGIGFAGMTLTYPFCFSLLYGGKGQNSILTKFSERGRSFLVFGYFTGLSNLAVVIFLVTGGVAGFLAPFFFAEIFRQNYDPQTNIMIMYWTCFVAISPAMLIVFVPSDASNSKERKKVIKIIPNAISSVSESSPFDDLFNMSDDEKSDSPKTSSGSDSSSSSSPRRPPQLDEEVIKEPIRQSRFVRIKTRLFGKVDFFRVLFMFFAAFSLMCYACSDFIMINWTFFFSKNYHNTGKVMAAYMHSMVYLGKTAGRLSGSFFSLFVSPVRLISINFTFVALMSLLLLIFGQNLIASFIMFFLLNFFFSPLFVMMYGVPVRFGSPYTPIELGTLMVLLGVGSSFPSFLGILMGVDMVFYLVCLWLSLTLTGVNFVFQYMIGLPMMAKKNKRDRKDKEEQSNK